MDQHLLILTYAASILPRNVSKKSPRKKRKLAIGTEDSLRVMLYLHFFRGQMLIHQYKKKPRTAFQKQQKMSTINECINESTISYDRMECTDISQSVDTDPDENICTVACQTDFVIAKKY